MDVDGAESGRKTRRIQAYAPELWGQTRLAGGQTNQNTPTTVEHLDWSRSGGSSLVCIDCKGSGEIWSRFQLQERSCNTAGALTIML